MNSLVMPIEYLDVLADGRDSLDLPVDGLDVPVDVLDVLVGAWLRHASGLLRRAH